MARKHKKKQLELNLTEVQSLMKFINDHDDIHFEKVLLRWDQSSGIGTGVSIKLAIDDKKDLIETKDITDWKDITDYSCW